MPEKSPRPEFVYRLATPEEWFAAREIDIVPTRDIDKRDGYMHLSTGAQALETANIHFADADALLALEIPLERIAGDVKFELAPKRGEAFPHLYRALRASEVARALRLEKTDAGFRFGDEV